ncbi:MAG: tetratricopeptide repeat protein [Myxococcota bacterium]|jgi:tetratricopeptide (TPR) repeat protein|nr:tetratricopeptide repeat protein [Myxococcota bacterium]
MQVERSGFLRVLLALSVLLGCSCSSTPKTVKSDELKPVKENSQAAPVEVKAPVEIVYTAQATQESREAIEAALEQAREGRNDEAIAALEAVLASDKQAFLAAFNLGVLLDQSGQSQRARAMYERSLEIEPEFGPALVNLVRQELREGKSALSTAERYIAQRPENLELQYAKVEALIGMRAYSDAVSLCQTLMRQDEANTRLRYYMALSHYLAGRERLAEFILVQTLEINPDDAEARYLLGQVYLSLELRPKAREQVGLAVSLKPDYPEAQNAMGLFYFETREFEEAEAAFRTALRYAPSFKEAMLNLGNTLKAQLRGDEAEKAYLEALKAEEGWADAHFSLGMLYLADVIPLSGISGMPRLEKAKAEFELARDTQDEAEREEVAEFLAKTEKAIGILQAEIELQQMEQGGTDPFAEEDPFGDASPEADGFDGDGFEGDGFEGDGFEGDGGGSDGGGSDGTTPELTDPSDDDGWE